MPKRNIPVTVKTSSAPAAVGPYSQGIIADSFLFVSGQLPLNPSTGELVKGNIAEKIHQIIQNIGAIAGAAGTDLSRVIKTTVFLTEMDDFEAMNEVYSQYFDSLLPARSVIKVAGLPKGADVEMEAIIKLP
jgi:2-iminobutanoate/2-iminopropanoate deaminase